MPVTNVYKGENGQLVIVPADTIDSETIIQNPAFEMADMAVVGRVKDVEVCIHTDLEEFHEIGRRHPVSLHPGNIYISGTIGRAFVNGALLTLLMGRGARQGASGEPFAQPRMVLVLNHSDPVVTDKIATLKIYDVMFANWNYKMTDEEFVMEKVSFKALFMLTEDTEDGNLVSSQFE